MILGRQLGGLLSQVEGLGAGCWVCPRPDLGCGVLSGPWSPGPSSLFTLVCVFIAQVSLVLLPQASPLPGPGVGGPGGQAAALQPAKGRHQPHSGRGRGLCARRSRLRARVTTWGATSTLSFPVISALSAVCSLRTWSCCVGGSSELFLSC